MMVSDEIATHALLTQRMRGLGLTEDELALLLNASDLATLTPGSIPFGERSSVFHASIDDQDLHGAGNVLITPTRTDGEWSSVVNGADFSGSPDHVLVGIDIQLNEFAASNYWALPEIIVLRNGVRIGAASSIMMQNNGTYSAQSTLVASILDPDPGTDPEYRFIKEEGENRTVDARPQAGAHIWMRGVLK